MAHVLNSISFYDHWTELLPDCLEQDTADEITHCMAGIWWYLYKHSDAFDACESPINCNIKIKPGDICRAASAVMSDRDMSAFMGESCSLKQMHELTRRFTTMIFQLCIVVEDALELEDTDTKTDTEEISFDF